MSDGEKVWCSPHDDEYHATPQCPTIPPKQRSKLQMWLGQPDGCWPCMKCCPAVIHYLHRDVMRVPVIYHTDEECSALKQEAKDAPTGYIAYELWPGREYDKFLHHDDAYRICRTCTLASSVFHSLGSIDRPYRNTSTPGKRRSKRKAA